MPCQVWLPYYIPPTVFPSHKKPNLQKLFSIPKSKHITLHPLCPATSTEPPPHPTCGEHDGEVLGLGFFFFFSLGFHSYFLFSSSSKHITLHPLCPATPTEPPPHPTCGKHDGEVLGLGSFFFTRFPFLFFSSQVRRGCHRCRC